MVGGREGDVVVEKVGEFSGECRSELGSSIGDDLVMEAESGKDVSEKDLSNVRCRGGFVARGENYPLRKTMVYHDQNGIIAVGEREVGDEVHGDLLERARAFGGDWGEWGMGRVGVDLVGLAGGAAGDELADEGGDAGPPIVFLE